jgi:predicted SAM-dependent methyltransferase
MTKLHLGCGIKHIDGFINIDVRYLPSVDRIENIKFLRSFKDNSVDIIYASHVLEHFSRWDYKNVLKRWFEILKPGGILRLGLPDFDALVYRYLKTGSLREISGLLYGGQDYEENYHYWIWNFVEIEKDLKEIGFLSVYRYDRDKTEHSNIDDFTNAYLPHLDKNGTLVSLNIEAIK